jgi:hypothetical protein
MPQLYLNVYNSTSHYYLIIEPVLQKFSDQNHQAPRLGSMPNKGPLPQVDHTKRVKHDH